MAIQDWANLDITKLLPEIRKSGEGPCHEFKAEFPTQAHELAKEVAAFATSGGGGLILIGVDDNGNVVGLNETERDQLRLRAQNVIAGVQPRPKIDVTPCFDGGFVLVVCVRRDQEEPVYYYDHRPYIRDGSQSRPATPDEVKERVWSHPSSEQRKRKEELDHEMSRRIMEQSLKRTEEADALSAMSSARFVDLMARSRENFQRTNEIVRRGAVPNQD